MSGASSSARRRRGRDRPPEPRSIDVRFVVGVAAVLSCFAIGTGFDGTDGPSVLRFLMPAAVWAVSLVILFLDARSGGRAPWWLRPGLSVAGRERTICAALAVVALFAAADFYHYGRFHGSGRFVHDHELYHYVIGSKYFDELGYDGLYCATYRALVEQDPSIAQTVQLVKDLRSYELEDPAVALERAGDVVPLFSEDRWQAFQDDIAFFRERIAPEAWRLILIDHGYNATPFWTFLGSRLGGSLELGPGVLAFIAALDPLLIIVMLVLARWGFGTRTALLFAIFLFANFFAVFDITGGAFLRQLWLAGVVGFVCCYAKGRMAAAGVCLAIATLDRVFPVLFALLPVVHFADGLVRRRTFPPDLVRFGVVFAVSLLLLGGASAWMVGGPSTWRSFSDNIAAHEEGFYFNQISMRTVLVVNPATARRGDLAGWDEASWRRERETLDARRQGTLLTMRIALTALLVLLLLVERRPTVCLALLSFASFVLLYPANYYSTVLGVAVLCRREAHRLAITVMALQGASWLLHMTLPSPLQMELLHWVVSLGLGLSFAWFLCATLIRSAGAQAVSRRVVRTALAAPAFLVIGGVVADVIGAARPVDRGGLDLIVTDVAALHRTEAHTQSTTAWGTGWSRDDHLAFVTEGPGAQATVLVPAGADTTCWVKIDYSTTPVSGVVELSVNGAAPRPAVNLYTPGVGMHSVAYRDVELRRGTNELLFTVTDKDAHATGHQFAVDRILLAESSRRPSPREAVDRALSWVREHPAVFADGGYDGIGSEILMLSALLESPHLVELRPALRDDLRARIARLDAEPAYRLAPAHVPMHLLVTHRRRELEPEATPAMTATPEAGRSLFACLYAGRLDAAASPDCDLDAGVMGQEYARRSLLPVLEGDVDRLLAVGALSKLAGVTRDVFAVTDFGREPPPTEGMLADRAFWTRICVRGIAWGIELADVLTVGRLLIAADCLALDLDRAVRADAIDFLIDHQEPDGSFGPARPHRPDPRREAVLTSLMALGAAPEGTARRARESTP
jgi:hypothetical protein